MSASVFRCVCYLQAEVLDLTADDFDEVLADGMVFVKFFAPWLVGSFHGLLKQYIAYHREYNVSQRMIVSILPFHRKVVNY